MTAEQGHTEVPTTDARALSVRRVFLAAWALLFVLTATWSLATPIGASPDEPAHMVKAASVVRGELIGEWSRTGHHVDVPQYVAFTHGQTCYAFDDEESAACIPDVPGDPAQLVDSSTTAGLYNPLYYALVGWPTLLLPDSAGIYAMRLVSAMLFSAFLALSFAMLASWRRHAIPTLALAVAATPMVLFLGSVVNPNSLEVVTVLAVFVGMLSITLERTPRIAPFAGIVAGAAFIGLQTRALAPLWIATALAIPLLLLGWREMRVLLRRRSILVAIAVVAVGAIGALTWTLSSGSLSSITVNAGEGFVYPGTGAPPYAGFTYVLEHTFEFAEGLIGVFGWLDVAAPTAVYFLWSALLGVLLLAAFTLLRRRRTLVAVVLVGAFLILPALIQAGYVTAGGLIWQGRYTLPLFVCMVVGLGALSATAIPGFERWRHTNRLTTMLVTALAVAQLYTFAAVLRRYAVGVDGTWIATLRGAEWEAPGGNILILVIFGLSVGLAGFMLRRLILVPGTSKNVTDPKVVTELR